LSAFERLGTQEARDKGEDQDQRNRRQGQAKQLLTLLMRTTLDGEGRKGQAQDGSPQTSLWKDRDGMPFIGEDFCSGLAGQRRLLEKESSHELPLKSALRRKLLFGSDSLTP
jgi:hypothetical protein